MPQGPLNATPILEPKGSNGKALSRVSSGRACVTTHGEHPIFSDKVPKGSGRVNIVIHYLKIPRGQ